MYIRRTLEQQFLKASNHFPVMLVTGARQVGKTTFLRELVQGGAIVREPGRSESSRAGSQRPGPFHATLPRSRDH